MDRVKKNSKAVSVLAVDEVWLSEPMVVLDVVPLLSPSILVSFDSHEQVGLQSFIPEVVRF